MLYEEILEQAGFSKEQSLIYSYLLKNGISPARKIGLETNIKRGLLYKVLDQLHHRGFIEKEEKTGAITLFKPKHPTEILDRLEQQKRDLQTATESVRAVVGQMTSDFNLISGKPSVQFFEGLDGMKSVLEDSLYAKEEIYSYVDLESVDVYIKDVNQWYVNEREKFGIKKKVLAIDTAYSRKFLENYHVTITDFRLLTLENEPFATIMQIYDDKVSYVTLGKQMIGVIITNPHIYEMHRKLFEHDWKGAPALGTPANV